MTNEIKTAIELQQVCFKTCCYVLNQLEEDKALEQSVRDDLKVLNQKIEESKKWSTHTFSGATDMSKLQFELGALEKVCSTFFMKEGSVEKAGEVTTAFYIISLYLSIRDVASFK